MQVVNNSTVYVKLRHPVGEGDLGQAGEHEAHPHLVCDMRVLLAIFLLLQRDRRMPKFTIGTVDSFEKKLQQAQVATSSALHSLIFSSEILERQRPSLFLFHINQKYQYCM